MTDLEISKALALAIGWREDQLEIVGDIHFGEDETWAIRFSKEPRDFHVFDYRDWNVIGPIAEQYDLFPFKHYDGSWDVQGHKKIMHEDTPQKAIALAVIQGVKS